MYCVTMHAPTGRKPRGAVAMVFLRNYTQYTRRYANRATLTQLGLAVYKPSQSLGGKHLCCVFQNSKNHEGRRMKIYKCFKNTTYELCNNNLIWIVNNHGATTSSKFIKVWKPVNLTEAFLQFNPLHYWWISRKWIDGSLSFAKNCKCCAILLLKGDWATQWAGMDLHKKF